MIEKIKEEARIYVGLAKDFDLEEECYYQPQKIEKYNAFLAGALAYAKAFSETLKD